MSCLAALSKKVVGHRVFSREKCGKLTQIREDPREQVLHRDAFVRAAAPLYRRASDAFGECAASTVQSGMDALEPWAAYCEEALRRLEDAPRPVSEPERAGD